MEVNEDMQFRFQGFSDARMKAHRGYGILHAAVFLHDPDW